MHAEPSLAGVKIDENTLDGSNTFWDTKREMLSKNWFVICQIMFFQLLSSYSLMLKIVIYY